MRRKQTVCRWIWGCVLGETEFYFEDYVLSARFLGENLVSQFKEFPCNTARTTLICRESPCFSIVHWLAEGMQNFLETAYLSRKFVEMSTSLQRNNTLDSLWEH